jgi:hypothetical protein
MDTMFYNKEDIEKVLEYNIQDVRHQLVGKAMNHVTIEVKNNPTNPRFIDIHGELHVDGPAAPTIIDNRRKDMTEITHARETLEAALATLKEDNWLSPRQVASIKESVDAAITLCKIAQKG